MAQAHARLQVQAAFVRAAVRLRLVHAVQHRVRDGALAAGVEDAGDAAHGGWGCPVWRAWHGHEERRW